MNTAEFIQETISQLKDSDPGSLLHGLRQEAIQTFAKLDIPTTRNEEWKYTRIGSLFNKEFTILRDKAHPFPAADFNTFRLPGSAGANELVFINGLFSRELSVTRSEGLTVMPLEEAAAGQYREFVTANLGHSRNYLKDGINAMNTACLQGGIFIQIKKGQVLSQPVFIYNITDAGSAPVLAQPRCLVQIAEKAEVQMVETYVSVGTEECFTNQVTEIVTEEGARLDYCKIQNDGGHASQVSTTHIRQAGKSYTSAVTISLNGNIIRNNLNVVLEAEHGEAHLYGLYFLSGKTHVDNHTVVDNVKPHCFSNEFYKGIIDDTATGVFNGKIFVRQPAQKTNAYQSNKNILLSENAVVNAKPQLEIFADDVKCSHGCTVGKLDEEGLFYLQSRGISKKMAKALLLYSFSADILEKINPEPIRNYIDQLIAGRLESIST